MRSNPAGLSRVIYPRFPRDIVYHITYAWRTSLRNEHPSSLFINYTSSHAGSLVFDIPPIKKEVGFCPDLLYVKKIC